MAKHPYLTVMNVVISACERADMLTVDNTPAEFVSPDTEGVFLLQAYNSEMAALWDALIAASEDYAIQRVYIDVVADVENYSLPSNFYKFRKVFPVSSGRRYTALRRFHLSELGEDSDGGTKYKITGNRLWLHPTPTTSALQLEVWYIPQYEMALSLGETTPHNLPHGWEEYIIEGLAARMLEKEESDSSPQRTRQMMALQRIVAMTEDRDVGEPHRMIDPED